MNVRRFTGNSHRDALRKVKSAFGDAALIMTNRETEHGVEIVAAREGDMVPSQGDIVLAAPAPGVAATTGECAEDRNAQLLSEVRDLKGMIASSTRLLQPGTSNAARLQSLIRDMGLSEDLQSDLMLRFPVKLQELNWEEEPMRDWLRQQLRAQLPHDDTFERKGKDSGILVLVGPTGSGKTTTIAKIAARYVMSHGSEEVGLISADAFRVGAQDHLREYAQLLDVSFCSVADGVALRQALHELRDKRFVLVDTSGLSQRDARIMQQFSELTSASSALEFALLLCGNCHPLTLEEVVEAYQRSALAAGSSINRCILTKLDEACSPGLLLDAVIRFGLLPLYTTAGQRVPEDLDEPDMSALLDMALDRAFSQQASRHYQVPLPPSGWSRELFQRGRKVKLCLDKLRDAVPGFPLLEAAWDISLLNPAWQQARFEELTTRTQLTALCRPAVLWGAEGDLQCDGADVPGHSLLLDDSLRPVVADCGTLGEHSMIWLQARFSSVLQIFPELPDIDTVIRLYESCWLSQASPDTQVWTNDEVAAVRELVSVAELHAREPLHFEGHDTTMELRQIPVRLAGPSMRKVAQLNARLWLVTVRADASGEALYSKYWISSESMEDETVIPALIGLERFSDLASFSYRQLTQVPGFQCCEGLRRFVAQGLAAAALRVQHSDHLDDYDLRAELAAMQGQVDARSADTLLESLTFLMIARELLVPANTN